MNSKGRNMKRVVHLDEKVLKPNDEARSGLLSGLQKSEAVAGDNLRPDGLQKAIIGKPKVYDLKGNLLADEENLVVLLGREYIAQLLAFRPGNNPIDYTKYKITHFGVGDGGTTNDCPPTTIGPFDDDTDLQNRVIIRDPSAGGTEPDYLDGGKLKRIEVDGEITIVQENHTINDGNLVGGGTGETVVQAYTAVRYTMYLQAGDSQANPPVIGEPLNKPFRFNEAGLYAVEYDNAGDPTGNYILFARFTTLDKWLEDADGIMIEWYVLV